MTKTLSIKYNTSTMMECGMISYDICVQLTPFISQSPDTFTWLFPINFSRLKIPLAGSLKTGLYCTNVTICKFVVL